MDHFLRKNWDPDLLLLTGDLAEEPTQVTYSGIVQRFIPLGIKTACLPGNHDDPVTMRATLTSKDLDVPKVVAIGQWRVLLLDSSQPCSSRGKLGRQQLDWLESTLREYRQNWVLVALHHHPISSGSPWMDGMRVEDSDEFLSLISAFTHVKACIFGHVHQDIDCNLWGIRFLGSPSTCVQFAPGCHSLTTNTDRPGYRVLDLFDTGEIETQVVRI
jgi:Icc protein